MAANRNSFLIQHLIPYPTRMFWKILTSDMFEALYTVFIISRSAFLKEHDSFQSGLLT